MTLLFPSPGEREKQESAMKPRLTVHDLHGTNQQISQSSSSPPSVKHHHQHKSSNQMNLLRTFPLLLLIIYTSAVILIRLFSSDSYDSLYPSVLSEVPRSELEILKTRVSSKQISLQDNEEKKRLITPPICQTLIDGKSEVTALGIRKDDMTGVMCCDRRHHRTDVCYLKGDVRTNPRLSILLYNSDSEHISPEKIRPYTRKWETPIMSTIDELTLVPVSNAGPTFNATGKCEVNHKVPAVVLSTGGYTGNVYHEFNDGLIPLYLTTERFDREVVLVVLEYHPWWMMKYETVVRKLSNYDVVDFRRDRRIHCFPEMIVGMRIHGELSVDPQLMPTGKGIQDFQSLLFHSFESNHATTTQQQQDPLPLPQTITSKKPKLVIFIRTRSRVILNLHAIIRRCKRTGFDVELLNPKRNTPLSQIHTILSTSTVMVAVHGAAMTHFLFLRPKAVLIQVVPLGLDWAADEYYGQPARKLGLEYVEYKVRPVESSLTKEYGLTDPVVSDPSVVTRRGWQETKRIYLEHQNVTLDVRRFGKVVGRAYTIVGSKYELYKKESRSAKG